MIELQFTVPGQPVAKARPIAARRSRSGNIDADTLRECLGYEKETGLFVWLTKGRRHSIGDVAGTTCVRGYVTICVRDRIYKAHRLAWLYVYGLWPKGQIDHIDRDKSNNRIANLRDVDNAINQQNLIKPKKNSTLKILGVSRWSDGRRGFRAQISVNGKVKYIGTFKTKEEAHHAYLKAKKEFHNEGFCR